VLHDPTRVRRLYLDPGAGLAPRSRTALYVTLRARDESVGLLALEHDRAFPPGEVELVAALAETAGLAIDNARRFGRLRTSNADDERSRLLASCTTGWANRWRAWPLDRPPGAPSGRRRALRAGL
jgi:GAF domain-containing protein